MKTIKQQLTLAFFACTLPNFVHANLFTDTPLQHAYQALATNQPRLAWQELNLALNQHTISSQHWQPIKREILSQTACGTALPLEVKLDTKLRLSVIKRSGLTSQGYQVRLSTEASPVREKILLTSPNGVVLLEGSLAASRQYQELESPELLHKPASGLFTLSVGDKQVTLLLSMDLLSMDRHTSWLTQSQQTNRAQVSLDLPAHIDGCPVAAASWQWFDKNYNMLGSKIPFQYAQENRPTALPIASKASYLSASVELVEFQQSIRIEYVQRLAIPYQ
ncbi:DUF2861 family protein [Vibrio tapetis]|uniref:DUF2861 domain-containing protein n=1 Tax=Vibrio tapetis subsp. tapetis TaxID=1671868 RepID=A0A2N8ZJE0_9VIBR|nr:DUF2861 family protein [Vibrio tapetis]SON52044.1 conserved exported protein of unknown function [Vibrio tapetis subsp. tapetis]